MLDFIGNCKKLHTVCLDYCNEEEEEEEKSIPSTTLMIPFFDAIQRNPAIHVVIFYSLKLYGSAIATFLNATLQGC